MSRTRDYILAAVIGGAAFAAAAAWPHVQTALGWREAGTEMPDAEIPEPETPRPEQPEPEQPDPETPDPETPEPETPEPEAPEPETPEPETPEPAGPATDWLGDEVAFLPPGDLVAGSGTGQTDDTIYAPGMRFPIELPRAFANSQVYGAGGQFGPEGWQCDPINYSYPWRDNFCEDRSYATPFCPSGTGHQGQDIRPPTCPPLEPLSSRPEYWAVAAADGQITGIARHIVTLDADDGTRYLYMHLEPDTLAVDVEDRVARGDRIGVVSNYFGSTPTTYHLHLEIRQTVAVDGNLLTLTPVPPYPSLVDSYQRLVGGEEGDFPAP